MLVELAVDVPQLGVRTFHYSLPPRLYGIPLGSALLVPFSGRMAVGYTLGFPDESEVDEVLSVSDLLDSPPVPLELLELCRWLAEYYVAPLSECLRLALPPGGGRSLGRELRLTPQGKHALEAESLGAPESAALAGLSEVFPEGLPAAEVPLSGGALRRVISSGLVDARWDLQKPRASSKQALVASLTPLGAAQDARELPAAQGRLLKSLQESGDCAVGELLKATGASRSSLAGLASKGIAALEKRKVSRAQPGEVARPDTSPNAPKLTPEQSEALSRINESLEGAGEPGSRTFLLRGVTASGKTEVYLRAIESALRLGRSALALVPEIALTPQTCRRFQERFGADVAVLHSALGLGRRYDEWHHIAAGERRVVVGTRSAVFAPLRNLGLIVVDEEQEGSYKQDRAPRYHVREVAARRAELCGAALVYGSATPSLELRSAAAGGAAVELVLPRRIEDRPFPRVEVVDLRKSGGGRLVSPELSEALALTLEREEKAMVFLNRRGFASFLLCRDCGHVPGCPHCSVSLTYHRAQSLLRCHHCGHWKAAPTACPQCGSCRLIFRGAGTERAHEELSALFPSVPVVRMDADTTRRQGSHAAHLRRFQGERKAVLLGTQMIAKGLDFQDVTLVGVLNADTALFLPDFRAAERAFQLLVQMSGRAGRGERAGRVVIQTYNPGHYAIECFIRGDYEGFYRQELSFREGARYPPFVSLVNVVVSAPDARVASEAAVSLRRRLPAGIPGVLEILGPAPAPVSQLKGRFRYHMLIKLSPGEGCAELRRILGELKPPSRDVSVALDVDPVTVL